MPKGLLFFGGAVIGGFAVLVALLVVSPAAFVGVLPGWFTADGVTRAVAWLVAGLSAGLAAVLVLRDSREKPGRGALIAVLVVVAAGFALLAIKNPTAPDRPAPSSEDGCVAYSGGRQTCPGG